MTSKSMRFQPYMDQDSNYEPLLAFVRRYAPLLEPGFEAPEQRSGDWRQSEPYWKEEHGWQHGDARGIKVSFNEEYEPRAMGIAVSGVEVATFGLGENALLRLRCERSWHDPRYIEMQVEGPDDAAATIVQAFEREFGGPIALSEEQLRRETVSAEVSIRARAWAAAEMHAATVLKQQPDNALALFCMGVALAAQGRIDEAAPHLERSLVLDPNNYDACYNLGNIRLAKGEHAHAAETFRRALEISPGNHPVLYRLGVALEKTDDREGAIAAYREAVATAPNPGQHFHYTGLDFEVAALDALRRLGAEPPETEADNGAGAETSQ